MRCLLKSKTQPKGYVCVLGVSFCAWLFLLRSGYLRGRSCNQKVASAFWACRFTLLPAANAARSKVVLVALSIDHSRAFETAFQTVLVGSRCRSVEVEARSVLVAVPILKWWFRNCFRPGRAAAVLEAPECVMRALLSMVVCSKRRSERCWCVRIVETLKCGKLSTVRCGLGRV